MKSIYFILIFSALGSTMSDAILSPHRAANVDEPMGSPPRDIAAAGRDDEEGYRSPVPNIQAQIPAAPPRVDRQANRRHDMPPAPALVVHPGNEPHARRRRLDFEQDLQVPVIEQREFQTPIQRRRLNVLRPQMGGAIAPVVHALPAARGFLLHERNLRPRALFRENGPVRRLNFDPEIVFLPLLNYVTQSHPVMEIIFDEPAPDDPYEAVCRLLRIDVAHAREAAPIAHTTWEKLYAADECLFGRQGLSLERRNFLFNTLKRHVPSIQNREIYGIFIQNLHWLANTDTQDYETLDRVIRHIATTLSHQNLSYPAAEAAMANIDVVLNKVQGNLIATPEKNASVLRVLATYFGAIRHSDIAAHIQASNSPYVKFYFPMELGHRYMASKPSQGFSVDERKIILGKILDMNLQINQRDAFIESLNALNLNDPEVDAA